MNPIPLVTIAFWTGVGALISGTTGALIGFTITCGLVAVVSAVIRAAQ